MIRTSSIYASMLTAVVGVGCLAPEASPPRAQDERDAPVVGRLQMNDRVIDLTLDAFADSPDAVPTNARAVITADRIVDSDSRDPRVEDRAREDDRQRAWRAR